MIENGIEGFKFWDFLIPGLTVVLLMNPLSVAVISEHLMRTPRELFPRRSMILWKGSVFFRTLVRAIRAITVRMEGFTAVA